MKEECKIIVIGGSAGSFNIVRNILSKLPDDYSIPVVMCLHRLKEYRNGFVESLNFTSGPEVLEPLDKDPVKSGKAYLSPANYHLLVESTRTFALSTEEEVNFSRPSLDLTFETVARNYRNAATAILLSGANRDGAAGIHYCQKKGAFTIVQDPDEAMFSTMPGEALRLFKPDRIWKMKEITDYLIRLHR
ncbi:MAG: chemotaxis protein CheB [Bacteroidota bacterium]